MPSLDQEHSTLKNIWSLTKPYWFSEDRRKARLLLAAVIGLTLGQVYLTVLLNEWNNAFYNALQNKNFHEFVHQLVVFSVLATCFIIVVVYRQYLNQMLQIRWRKWMTDRYRNAWLSDHAYYRLQVIYKSTDNPDQRISEDIDGFISNTLSLSVGLLNSVVTLASFTAILWGLSGTLAFTLAGHAVAIPGYMLWVAIFYALIGTWLTHLIGRPLVQLNFSQQQFEANFRYSMVRLRENTENIAFYKGEPVEREVLSERFSHIFRNWWQIMKKQKQLNWFTSGYSQIAIIFPFVVAAPRYFSGAIQLGGLMQTASAFGRVHDALSWFVDAYTLLASWKATTNRLIGFTHAIEKSSHDAAQKQITISHSAAKTLDVHDLTLALPDGGTLIEHFNLTLEPGERLLLTGASGSGKTTLMRALAGLWPYGSGGITLPQNAGILFVPQKPYLPLLSLRAIICYPQTAGTYDDIAIKTALGTVGLSNLAAQLDVMDNWAQSLSPGEQQKLAFAKILLQKPDIVLLDEATASLDEDAETQLYKALTATLTNAIIISAGHRSTLHQWHSEIMDL